MGEENKINESKLQKLALEFKTAESARLQAEDEVKELKKEEGRAEAALFQAMTEEQIESVKLKNGMKISCKKTLFASCTLDNIESVKLWFAELGLMPEGVRENVNVTVLKAAVKDCIDNGRAGIPEYIKYYIRESVSVKE